EYLRELVSSIKASYGYSESLVIIHVAAANIEMDVTKAIPIGLIINELLSNVYKHAFKGRESGNLYLTMKEKESKDGCLIEVKDDGVGISSDALKEEPSSLGFTIVRGLCEQIGGKLNISSENGTCVTIDISREDLL
ncbi:sensor histidine kinase, partial [Balneolaceae bacterium ANBcel3]|nr:sensor histidine kinase [Balneolaceae bacterium ANBcel3]